jgi:hypothetical protein
MAGIKLSSTARQRFERWCSKLDFRRKMKFGILTPYMHEAGTDHFLLNAAVT